MRENTNQFFGQDRPSESSEWRFVLLRVPRLAAIMCQNTVRYALSAVSFRLSRREGDPHFVHATGRTSIACVEATCEGDPCDTLLPSGFFAGDTERVALEREASPGRERSEAHGVGSHAVGLKGLSGSFRQRVPQGTFPPIGEHIPSSRGVRVWIGLNARRLRELADAVGDDGGVFLGIGGLRERIRVLSVDHTSRSLGVLLPVVHDDHDAASLSRQWDRNREAVLVNLGPEFFIEDEIAQEYGRVGAKPYREPDPAPRTGTTEEGTDARASGCEGSALAKEAASSGGAPPVDGEVRP